MSQHDAVSLEGVFRAERFLRSYLKPTQLIEYQSLSELIGARVFVKHENHNPGGSYKIRGGLTIINALKKRGVRGVITFSTGNHGISIATAARMLGVAATVVVPEHSNPTKTEQIQQAGAQLIEAGSNFEEAAAFVAARSESEGLYFVHAANEPDLINGVGTGALEIYRDLPEVDVVIYPLGAGSEVSGALTVFRALKPKVEVIAVQAEQSRAAYESWVSGSIRSSPNRSFAGGIATGTAFELPFSIYSSGLKDFLLLTEEEIKQGIALCLRHTHNLAEGAGAAPVMAALKQRTRLQGKTVVLQMSGCNEDPRIIKEVVADYL